MEVENPKLKPNFYTVKEFCKKKPSWPSESALRALILDASWGVNKFQTAFIRVGRRVLVDEIEFWKCLKGEE